MWSYYSKYGRTYTARCANHEHLQNILLGAAAATPSV